jgi:hypothetical protein
MGPVQLVSGATSRAAAVASAFLGALRCVNDESLRSEFVVAIPFGV